MTRAREPENTDKPAVAYYRHLPRDRRKTLITAQREQVRQWAKAGGITIAQEFTDHDES